MRILHALAIVFLSCCSVEAAAQDGFAIEHFSKVLSVHEDGSWVAEQSATVRVESDAAVRQFGTLSFTYSPASQTIEILSISVRKASGEVVVTPATAAQEVTTDVGRVASAYSDEREKRVPVRALQPGDVLEYQVRFKQKTPDALGEFWYSHHFLEDQPVRDERLVIRVPARKYVQVVSTGVEPDVRTEGSEKVYRWARTRSGRASVEVTTFRSWQELGVWYAGFLRPQVRVTPSIQAKADEITRGLNTREEMQHALYQYVSTQFRYVAVALGAAKYRPHSSDEVLANGYGDCKDKHTLLAALLKAEGIAAWPALIGSDVRFDESIPTPSHFDHVVTVVAEGTDRAWLDTTPEVAPYGLLAPELRGAKALLLADEKRAELVTTPTEPPFPARQEMISEAHLSTEGTLTARMQLIVRGDDELAVRRAFHHENPSKWPQLVQALAANMGLDGSVSNVQVDAPDQLDKPFHFSFDYERKKYSDWENLRIGQPLLPFVFAVDENDPNPISAIRIGAVGKMVHRSTIHLPSGLAATLPEPAKVDLPFASYKASYTIAGDTLIAERHVEIKQAKIEVADWQRYTEFLQLVRQSESEYTQLAEAGAAEAEALIEAATGAIARNDTNTAAEQLTEAELLSPKHSGLWSAYAEFYKSENKPEAALAAQRKEVENHPASVAAQLALAELLLQSANKAQGVALLEKICSQTENPDILNNAAYLLADAGVATDKALGYARRALSLLESRMSTIDLDALRDADLRDVESLASVWDTLGWSLYKTNDTAGAKRYLKAAWNLGQHRGVAGHLQQVEPETPDAMQFTRQQLTSLRSIELPRISNSGTAEFYLLFEKNRAVSSRFIRGADCLKGATELLLTQSFPPVSPDNGPERIIRRAVLDCTAGQCRATLLLPAAAIR